MTNEELFQQLLKEAEIMNTRLEEISERLSLIGNEVSSINARVGIITDRITE